jgi:hypothetical protein
MICCTNARHGMRCRFIKPGVPSATRAEAAAKVVAWGSGCCRRRAKRPPRMETSGHGDRRNKVNRASWASFEGATRCTRACRAGAATWAPAHVTIALGYGEGWAELGLELNK